MPTVHQYVGCDEAVASTCPVQNGGIITRPNQDSLRGGYVSAEPGNVIEFGHEPAPFIDCPVLWMVTIVDYTQCADREANSALTGGN
jgi:hypothetical protein